MDCRSSTPWRDLKSWRPRSRFGRVPRARGVSLYPVDQHVPDLAEKLARDCGKKSSERGNRVFSRCFNKHWDNQIKTSSMWLSILALSILLAQANPSGSPSKAYEWCFETGKNSQLCRETEAACEEYRRVNEGTATSACKRVEPPEIRVSPTQPPAPPNPERQTPTQR